VNLRGSFVICNVLQSTAHKLYRPTGQYWYVGNSVSVLDVRPNG